MKNISKILLVIKLTLLLITRTIAPMENGIQKLPPELLEHILCSNLISIIKDINTNKIKNILDFCKYFSKEDIEILLGSRLTCSYFNEVIAGRINKLRDIFINLKDDWTKIYKGYDKNNLNQMLKNKLSSNPPNLKKCCRIIFAGANPNIKNNWGSTTLILAAQLNRVEIVKLILLKSDIKVDKNRCGNTALMWAASFGNVEIVKLLLKFGANPNSRHISGNTVLMDAVYSGDINIVKLLLEHGAAASSSSNNGDTALNIAKREKHIDIVNLIINYQNKNNCNWANNICLIS